MDRETAERINVIVKEIYDRLDQMVDVSLATSGQDEVQELKLAVGKLMTDMLSGVQIPLYSQYPDLIPSEYPSLEILKSICPKQC